ncbi:hypothetical protein B0J14DRAFT_584032 [Halenospora varia]|nr:hypothetical protein B0J14DRAFT_584032 [Halenospora varia]
MKGNVCNFFASIGVECRYFGNSTYEEECLKCRDKDSSSGVCGWSHAILLIVGGVFQAVVKIATVRIAYLSIFLVVFGVVRGVSHWNVGLVFDGRSNIGVGKSFQRRITLTKSLDSRSRSLADGLLCLGLVARLHQLIADLDLFPLKPLIVSFSNLLPISTCKSTTS